MPEKIVCKKIFDLGKVSYYGKSRRCPVTIELELRQRGGDQTFVMNGKERVYTGEKTPEYLELAICGNIWNHIKTDIYCGGQCLDTIAEYRRDMTPQRRQLFDTLYALWKEWHLNAMTAGTPEQELFVKNWIASGNRYDYERVKEALKEAGLYEVPYSGLSIGRRMENEMYKYGHAWLIRELPDDVVRTIKNLCQEAA